MKFARGVTMIETVIYIAFIALLVPAMIYMLMTIVEQNKVSGDQILITQTAALIQAELQQDLQSAQSINVTSSSFGIDYSELVYIDADGVQRTILLMNDTFTKTQTPKMIGRLQTVSLINGTEWLTANTIDVNRFYVQPVYSAGSLVGIRLELEIQPIDYESAKEDVSVIQVETMFELAPYVTSI